MSPCACAVVTRVIASNACNRWSNFLCGDSPNKARDNHKAMGRAVTLRSLSKDGDLGLAVAWIDPYYCQNPSVVDTTYVVECLETPRKQLRCPRLLDVLAPFLIRLSCMLSSQLASCDYLQRLHHWVLYVVLTCCTSALIDG